ncbi:hypothetical protein ABT278_42330 [Streptomyces sp. NPDC001228]|uniref:hypothetical protein n=1 Tax=Streptomyces sp. NPDC001228 TaxID=3154381 RepID=UPI00331C4BA8
MLDGEGIPDTEPLHAFLLACDVAPGQAREWHHTATRLKIIRARVDERPEHAPFVVWFPQVLRRLRGHLTLTTLVGVATLTVTILQIVAMVGYNRNY